ncbi:hypothetical protein V8E36_002765 [Tilletia maclaganii]
MCPASTSSPTSSRILHKAARNHAEPKLCSKHHKTGPHQPTIESSPPSPSFQPPRVGLRACEQVTKACTIESILGQLDDSGLDKDVTFLESEVPRGVTQKAGGKKDEVTRAGGRRKWAIDQLLNVVRFHAPAAVQQVGEAGSAFSALRDEKILLRRLRLFETSKAPTRPRYRRARRARRGRGTRVRRSCISSSSIRAMLRSRFLSGLQDLSALTILRVEPEGKKHRVAGVLIEEA